MSGWVRTYWVVGGLWLTVLTLRTAAGDENDPEARHALPANVRTSPGGFRSFHFWHAGYSGGK